MFASANIIFSVRGRGVALFLGTHSEAGCGVD